MGRRGSRREKRPDKGRDVPAVRTISEGEYARFQKLVELGEQLRAASDELSDTWNTYVAGISETPLQLAPGGGDVDDAVARIADLTRMFAPPAPAPVRISKREAKRRRKQLAQVCYVPSGGGSGPIKTKPPKPKKPRVAEVGLSAIGTPAGWQPLPAVLAPTTGQKLSTSEPEL